MRKCLKNMVPPTRIERAARGLGIRVLGIAQTVVNTGNPPTLPAYTHAQDLSCIGLY